MKCLPLLCAGYTYEPISGVLSLQSTVNATAATSYGSALWANSYGLNVVLRDTLPK
jgi:hypothetical protein